MMYEIKIQDIILYSSRDDPLRRTQRSNRSRMFSLIRMARTDGHPRRLSYLNNSQLYVLTIMCTRQYALRSANINTPPTAVTCSLCGKRPSYEAKTRGTSEDTDCQQMSYEHLTIHAMILKRCHMVRYTQRSKFFFLQLHIAIMRHFRHGPVKVVQLLRLCDALLSSTFPSTVWVVILVRCSGFLTHGGGGETVPSRPRPFLPTASPVHNSAIVRG